MSKRAWSFIETLFDVMLYLIIVPHILFLVSNNSSVRDVYEGGSFGNLPLYVCLVAMFFFPYSCIRTVVTYNQSLRESFWEKKVDPSLKSRFLFLAGQWEFWIKAFIIALIYLLLPLTWTVRPLAAMVDAVTSGDKLLCLAVVLPTLFVSAVLAHLSAYKRWGTITNPAAYSKKRYNKEIISAGFAYLCGSLVFIMLFPVLLPILVVAIGSLTVGRVITIVVLLCLPPLFRVFRALTKRRSFLRSLKEICTEKGYTLSEIRDPYRSLFTLLVGESFTLTIGEKSYSCKLISGRKRSVSIAISKNGDLTYIRTVSIRGAVIRQRTTTYELGYESENPKIFIVNPVPKQVYEFYMGKITEIDNGAVIGDYKFYAATGFLRAAELNTLDK